MPRIPRSDILARFHAMNGAGSRSSAPAPEPAFRPKARRPAAPISSSSTIPGATAWPAADQLAGHDAVRRRQRHSRGDGARGAAGRLLYAGARRRLRRRSVPPDGCLSDEVAGLASAACRIFRRWGSSMAASAPGLKKPGWVTAAKGVKMTSQRARAPKLLTRPYIFDAVEAAAMARASADSLVCPFRYHRRRAIGAATAIRIEDCPALTDAMAEAALAVNPDA